MNTLSDLSSSMRDSPGPKEKGGEIHHTINGLATKMESEMTIAANHADKQIDGGMREGSNLLMIWAMGTAHVRIQTDPGICFHPGCVISHTQYRGKLHTLVPFCLSF